MSCAPHFNKAVTPVIMRFSSGTGDPSIRDSDPAAQPRGLAIRFLLSDDGNKHTDIIAHSVPFFPMPTAEGFLAFQQARGNGTMKEFVAKHPTAERFVEAEKPCPKSFASERYYGLFAFRLVGGTGGKARFVKYRFEPVDGVQHFSAEEGARLSDNYLYEELVDRVRKGKVRFKFLAQVARDGDVINDITATWPEDRNLVELGEIVVERVLEEQKSDREQQKIVFDPVPRVKGVESNGDPLLDFRSSTYRKSGSIRRAAL